MTDRSEQEGREEREEWTIEQAAAYIGAGSTGSARRTLSRWGVRAVAYRPGPSGRPMAHYDAEAVRAAHAARPGRGTRTDLRHQTEGSQRQAHR